MVELGLNSGLLRPLGLPTSLLPRWKTEDQEVKAPRGNWDLNLGHIKRNQKKQIKLIFIAYFVWPNISKKKNHFNVESI